MGSKNKLFERMLRRQAATIEGLEADKAALEAEVASLKAKKDEHAADLVGLDTRLKKLEPPTAVTP